jgi:SSS family solute:Na+ symporter
LNIVDTALSVGIIIAYAALLTLVVVRARAAREFEDFSLAGRALPLAMVFGSLAATYVGPGFSIGFVGRGFTSGFLFLGVALAYAVQNILVGMLLAPRLRALKNCRTLGDAIGQKYDRKCHVAAGIISVGLCAGFAAVMAKAGGGVLHDFFALPYWSCVFIVVAVTALYTTFGGLRASVITDAFQFSTFAILLPLALLFVLAYLGRATDGPGVAEAFARQASAATAHGLASTPPLEIISLMAAFLLGETLIPPYANRALASATTQISRNGFILGGIFSALWFMVMISLGIAARSIVPPDVGEDVVLLTLIKSTMPTSGHTLLLIALLSVIMSSLASLLNAGAVAFAEDVVKPLVALSRHLPAGRVGSESGGLADDAALNVSRVATIAIALIAAAGVVVYSSIIEGLLICYTIWAPAILPVLVIGLWAERPRPLAGILSMVIGTLAAIVLQFWIRAGVPTIIAALFLALAAYLLGHILDARIANLSRAKSRDRES